MKKMFWGLIVVVCFLPLGGVAQDVTPEDLIKKSALTNRSVRDNASDMTSRRRAQIFQKLEEIETLVEGIDSGEDSGPTAYGLISGITRKSGGAYYTIQLQGPTMVDRLSLNSPSGLIKVYNGQVIFTDGTHWNMYELEGNNFFYDRIQESFMRKPVASLEFRAEAWDSDLNLEVFVEGAQGEESFQLLQ